MTSLGPWFGGRGGGDQDLWYCSDVWDPLGLWPRSSARDGERDDEVSVIASANVDWRETENSHIFRADLPGVRKEDLKVQVEDGNNVLEISGERVKEEEEESDKWHRVERRRGSFVRRFRLPGSADLKGIKCGLENGVLTVMVPKKEAEPSQKKVRYIDVV